MSIQNALPLVGNKTVGLRTEYATLLPPGSKVAAYVGSIQSDSLDAYSASTLLVQTLNAGLARCRPGKGDVVVVLPGHTENVSTADFMNNLVAGTQILGVAPFGSGLMPTLTFTTTTAATFLLDQPNCTLSGIKFVTAIDNLVVFMPVTGSGCYIGGNYFQCGNVSTNDILTGMTIGTGASDLTLEGNLFITTGTAANTNLVSVSGTIDNLRLVGNRFTGSTAAGALVQIGVAASVVTNLDIGNNYFFNKGASTVTLGLTDVAHTGLVYNNYSSLLASSAAATTGITPAGATNILVQYFLNQTNDGSNKGTTGTASPATAAT